MKNLSNRVWRTLEVRRDNVALVWAGNMSWDGGVWGGTDKT